MPASFTAGGPTIDIRFSWEGSRGVVDITRKLVTFGQSVSDLSPAWEQVGTVLLGDFERNFEQEGGFFGRWARWAQLAPSTVRERERLGFPGRHPILQRTGALAESVTQRDGRDNVFEVGPNSLRIGTTNPYAGYHNSSAPRRRLPRRPIVALSAKRQGFGTRGRNNESVVGILNGYLAWKLAQANLDYIGDGSPEDFFDAQ